MLRQTALSLPLAQPINFRMASRLTRLSRAQQTIFANTLQHQGYGLLSQCLTSDISISDEISCKFINITHRGEERIALVGDAHSL